jgi:7,8-dihydroneopterin aldolase/epimerase/oxygenase
MRRSTEITLRAMRFHALVGILPHEHTTPQPIEIDLVATVGDGDSVVDYRRLYEATAAVISAGHIDYLEEIGERVASGAFAASERVTAVTITVRKPHVAIGGPIGAAEVRMERVRQRAGA